VAVVVAPALLVSDADEEVVDVVDRAATAGGRRMVCMVRGFFERWEPVCPDDAPRAVASAAQPT
jgi:uncharacterized protein YbjT (DUF2867 family)